MTTTTDAPQAARPRGMTTCPECFAGARFANCEACGGSGNFSDELCARCGGAGQVELEGPCPACAGSGLVTTAYVRIADAAAYAAGEVVAERRHGDDAGEGEVWAQTHEGVTVYGLAAYGFLRERLRTQPRVLVEATQVPGHLGHPMPVTAVRVPGLSLLLSGVTWGYTGTGPNGLAAILHDLGAFEDHRQALGWVAARPQFSTWSLVVVRAGNSAGEAPPSSEASPPGGVRP
ncbi:MAG TPA: hypothetical protein VET24_05780 [Actinomycetota bacterium]|nr:hypothetical protein [Actinomycetota bacterium]